MAAPGISDVKIVNVALTKLGAKRITSLTDNTKAARAANAIYAIKRDELLGEHPWKFANKRIALALLSTAPLFGFTNAFQLPTDYIGNPSTSSEEILFTIEGDQLYTDEGDFDLKYTSRITDPTKFSYAFITAFELLLKWELAYTITTSRSKETDARDEYIKRITVSKSLDAQQGGTPRVVKDDDWLKSRSQGR